MKKKLSKEHQAGTAADSGQKVEITSVSQHSSKPPVVCSQSQVCNLSDMPYLDADYLKKRKQTYDEVLKILVRVVP